MPPFPPVRPGFGTNTPHFLGNFAQKRVGTLAFDLNIFSGLEVPDRAVTLDLETTLGTGDFAKGVDAYYIGTDISRLPVGWHTYKFPVNAASPTIPAGWVVTKGNGRPGTDADWQALMQDVETMGVELGEPGFFYPFGSGISVWITPGHQVTPPALTRFATDERASLWHQPSRDRGGRRGQGGRVL